MWQVYLLLGQAMLHVVTMADRPFLADLTRSRFDWGQRLMSWTLAYCSDATVLGVHCREVWCRGRREVEVVARTTLGSHGLRKPFFKVNGIINQNVPRTRL